ncbi:strigolactones hydrolase CXE15-like [Rutidosis leptorrhynchoides]|uniref:strigolactones hydrolase CXE15-like n=1 Tax=Rutidosis leptorrhynchoides TaxID=125765 RepID=UPI003A98FB72
MSYLPYVVEDCQGVIQIFSDGSIHRQENIDLSRFQVIDDGSVVWKDHCYDKHLNLKLRLYKPKSATKKLPIVYFLHGGGFCNASFTWPNCHNLCLRIASALSVILVVPDHRLAPEHRLPAAFDDSLTALKWLQEMVISHKSDQLVNRMMGIGDIFDYFDFDNFFIIGDSSGGTIAHHLAVQQGPGSPVLTPIKIRGYVMLAPFFGGQERMKSEVEGTDEWLTVETMDILWKMSLPIGKSRDHPFANPFGPMSPSLELLELDPILIIVSKDETMKDRVKFYAEKLQEYGKVVRYSEFDGEHGFYRNDPYSDVSNSLLNLIKEFMVQYSS